MRKNMLSFLIVILLGVVAVAQDHALPSTSAAGNEGGVWAWTPEAADAEGLVRSPLPPSYCSPCIFYSGDFSPKAKKLPNGLLNGVFEIDGTPVDGEVWVPFSVKKQVTITGMFVNELFNSTFSSVTVNWEIQEGMSAGVGGTTVCSGSGTATATPTGRSFDGLTEMTIQVQLPEGEPCVLDGKVKSDPKLRFPPPHGQCTAVCYNMLVQPEVGELGESSESDIVGYLSDVEGSGAHHFGLKNVVDDSFFSSASFGFDFESTAPDGVCEMDTSNEVSLTRVGCDMFSVGLTGTGR